MRFASADRLGREPLRSFRTVPRPSLYGIFIQLPRVQTASPQIQYYHSYSLTDNIFPNDFSNDNPCTSVFPIGNAIHQSTMNVGKFLLTLLSVLLFKFVSRYFTQQFCSIFICVIRLIRDYRTIGHFASLGRERLHRTHGAPSSVGRLTVRISSSVQQRSSSEQPPEPLSNFSQKLRVVNEPEAWAGGTVCILLGAVMAANRFVCV